MDWRETPEGEGPSVEERLRCLEEFVHQLFSLTTSTLEWPPLCPYCEGQELLEAEGTETESTGPNQRIHTWCCPECGFFLNTAGRIDPESIELNDEPDDDDAFA